MKNPVHAVLIALMVLIVLLTVYREYRRGEECRARGWTGWSNQGSCYDIRYEVE